LGLQRGSLPGATVWRSEARLNSFCLASRRASSFAFSAAALEIQGTLAFDRIKAVSKRGPFERWDLPLSEEQMPQIVEIQRTGRMPWSQKK
jgi:hypothetical protein